ncbi:hypothetical protein R0J90_17210, partial [Micrococcus sp. SIMBA_144]
VVGPVIEKKEGELVKEIVLDSEWVNYEGAIPHSEMEGLYSHPMSCLTPPTVKVNPPLYLKR